MKEAVVGKVGNASVEAKEQARARRIEMEIERRERDERVDDATAAVIVACADFAAARDLADALNAAARAQLEATVAANDEAAAAVVADSRRRIAGALGRLAAERLTPSQVARLTGLAPGEVRRIVREAR